MVDSRSVRDGQGVRRRRECIACNHRFTTYETIEKTPVLVIKKDGRREPYSREQFLSGLMKSCEKRPVSRAQLDDLLDEVENELFGNSRAEVTSREIGEAAMNGLQKIDDVAYVRFASVYRSFRDVNQFMDELRNLLQEKSGDS